jgi:hypothetical protein
MIASVALLVVAAAGLAVALRSLLVWQRRPSNLLLFCVLALGAVSLATLLAGFGHFLGAGDQLRDLHALPLLLGTFTLPLTLFSLATLSRRIGFAWARPDWGHGALCLVAVALLVIGLPQLLALRKLGAACWRDALWYQTSVPPELQCAGQTYTTTSGGTPWGLLVVVAAYAGLALGLRQRHRGFMVSMMVAVLLLLLPASWGPLPWFLGQTLALAGAAWVTTRYADLLQQRPAEPQ